jgi:hypothetical protein
MQAALFGREGGVREESVGEGLKVRGGGVTVEESTVPELIGGHVISAELNGTVAVRVINRTRS